MKVRPPLVFAVLAAAVLSSTPSRAGADPPGLDALYDRVAKDARAGRPLVVQVHVALCDNHQLVCGGRGLGDGDDLEKNLYWATSGGLRGWFGRRGSGWTLAARERGARGGVIETLVWRRRVEPSGALASRGVRAPFDVFVVADGWRGRAIDRAIDAYAADLFGAEPRAVALPDGTTLAAGGAAHVVAYVGHDRWMDRDDFAWPAPGGGPVKGTIAVACFSADYLAAVPAPARVPLLMTRDFLFAGSHSFEGAVRAFAAGESLAGIRVAAARAYADGEGKSFARVQYAFTNPSDAHWKKR
ncbi:MAG TPA: hypothetical protein VFF06_16435 [Polyangia bacterium]|nr:hypothetical protein [Polyangia bacterium]